jgi:hypothetical protein
MTDQIKRVEHILRDEFEQKYLNKKIPVVISSGLKWKALTWTPNYFKKLFPNKIVDLDAIYSVQIDGKDPLKVANVETRCMKEAVDLICKNRNSNIKYYLCQKPIYKEFPELVQDFEKPPWRDKEQDYDESFVNLWFGEAGNVTHLHFDGGHNFLVQIYGRKYIRLFAPKDTEYLYRHTARTRGPSHVSQIPDIDNVDNSKYSQFKYATAYETVLLPGETLFIPAGWWHDVRSIDHAISINFWWVPKIHERPFSQMLPVSAYELFEIGKFHDMYHFFPDLNDFKNDLETSKYFLDGKNYCISILFMANYIVNKLKAIAMLLNIPTLQKNTQENINTINQSILIIDENLGIPIKTLYSCLNLIEKTKDEKFLFEKGTLISMFKEIEVFSNKTKKLLLGGRNS